MLIRSAVIEIYPEDRITNVTFDGCTLYFHFEIKGVDFLIYDDPKFEFDVYREDTSDEFKQVFGQDVIMKFCEFLRK